MSNELVVLNNDTKLEVSTPLISGMGLNLKSSVFQFKPANLNIVQPNSTLDGAIKGNLMVGGEADMQFKTMRVAFLDTPVEKRAYYVGDRQQLNRTPENLECFCNEVLYLGDNRKNKEISKPSPYARTPQALVCGNCPKADWGPYREMKNKGLNPTMKDIPPCESYFYAMLIDTKIKMPLQMFVRSKSKDPFLAGLDKLFQRFVILQAETKQVPNIFDVSFTLSTKLIQTGKFPSYVLQLSEFAATTDEEREAFGGVFQQYISAKQQYAQRLLDSDNENAQQAAIASADESINQAVVEGTYEDLPDTITI